MDRLSFDATFARNLSALSVRSYTEGLAANSLLAMWRRRYLILAAMVLSLLAGGVGLILIQKKYTAEAIVLLDLSRRDGNSGTGQSPVVMLEAAAVVQGESRIIRSRPIARRVVDRLGLADDPAYAAEASGLARYLARGMAMGAQAIAWLRGSEPPQLPAEQAEADEGARADRAVRTVLTALSVSSDNRSYLITIASTLPDAAAAARIANAFAEEYVRWRVQTNSEAASRTSDWLAAQLRSAAAALQAAEAEIAALRERTGLLNPPRLDANSDTENVLQQQLRALTTQLSGATLARMGEERRFARVQELLRTGNLPSASDLQGLTLIPLLLEREATARRDLGELLSRFGPRHPSVLSAQAGIADIRTRIQTELRRSVAVISGDLAAAQQTERELQTRLDALQRTMIAGTAPETELRSALENAQAIRDRLASLRRSHEQALAARDLPAVAATLVQPAEQERIPSSPKPALLLGFALVGGLGIGVAATALLERRDRGLGTSGDIRSRLDMRCLGMLPDLPDGKPGAAAERDRAIFDEAVYAVGAGVSLFDTPSECRVVLVTSAVSGEGKSTLCRALAAALVASGQRVMLLNGVPGQPARGGVRAIASAHGRAADDNALPMAPPNDALAVLDRRNPFPFKADVFRPGGFGSLIGQARKHFDVILLEGAPIMLVADSLVLGRLADTVIVVARWANTRQQVVDIALRRLQDHSITADGLVLTRVNLRRHAKLRFVDECFFYLKEKRFYEHLAGQRGRNASSSKV